MNILLTEIQSLNVDLHGLPEVAPAGSSGFPDLVRQNLDPDAGSGTQVIEYDKFFDLSPSAQASSSELPALAWERYLGQARLAITVDADAAPPPAELRAMPAEPPADEATGPESVIAQQTLPPGEDLPPGGNRLPQANPLPVAESPVPIPPGAVPVSLAAAETAAPRGPVGSAAAPLSPTPSAPGAVPDADSRQSMTGANALATGQSATHSASDPRAIMPRRGGNEPGTGPATLAVQPLNSETAVAPVKPSTTVPLADATLGPASRLAELAPANVMPAAAQGSAVRQAQADRASPQRRDLLEKSVAAKPDAPVADAVRMMEAVKSAGPPGRAAAEFTLADGGMQRAELTAAQASAAAQSPGAASSAVNLQTVTPAQAGAALQGGAVASGPTEALNLGRGSDIGDWGNGLGERVSWMINQKQNTAIIRLDPPLLGKLDVQVRITDDATTITIQTQHAQTRDAIESAAPRLRDFLQDSGYQNVNVDVSHRQDQQQARSQVAEDQGHSGPPGDESARETSTEHRQNEHLPYLGADGLIDTFA